MQVFGIAAVRNEVDVIRASALYHLALGCDRLLIIDNGSEDGTDRVLRELSTSHPVMWHSNYGVFRQSEVTSNLAREAFKHGADWVVPFDADEFWYAPGGDFRQILACSTAGGLRAEIVNFVQARAQRLPAPEALLTMTRRVAAPTGPVERCQELVESRQIAYVEMQYPQKWISRPTTTIAIAQGNHAVVGVNGPLVHSDTIACLHAPLRSRAGLEAKALSVLNRDLTGRPLGESWHLRRLLMLHRAGALDQEWAANSYADNTLDVYGAAHPVIFDSCLRDAVTPFIMPPVTRRSRLRAALSLRRRDAGRAQV